MTFSLRVRYFMRDCHSREGAGEEKRECKSYSYVYKLKEFSRSKVVMFFSDDFRALPYCMSQMYEITEHGKGGE